MNEAGWLLGVRTTPWDHHEGSNGHKSISRKAVMRIMMLLIYIDGYFPDWENGSVEHRNQLLSKSPAAAAWGLAVQRSPAVTVFK